MSEYRKSTFDVRRTVAELEIACLEVVEALRTEDPSLPEVRVFVTEDPEHLLGLETDRTQRVFGRWAITETMVRSTLVADFLARLDATERGAL